MLEENGLLTIIVLSGLRGAATKKKKGSQSLPEELWTYSRPCMDGDNCDSSKSPQSTYSNIENCQLQQNNL